MNLAKVESPAEASVIHAGKQAYDPHLHKRTNVPFLHPWTFSDQIFEAPTFSVFLSLSAPSGPDSAQNGGRAMEPDGPVCQGQQAEGQGVHGQLGPGHAALAARDHDGGLGGEGEGSGGVPEAVGATRQDDGGPSAASRQALAPPQDQVVPGAQGEVRGGWLSMGRPGIVVVVP